MRPSTMKRLTGSLNDIRRRVEIRLSNFQMDDIFPLFFKRLGAYQNLESGLGSQARHPLGESQIMTYFLHSWHRQNRYIISLSL